MADLKTLSVQKRDGLGKGPNRRLRAEQVIPCVFYDAEGTNVSVQASSRDLTKLFGEVGRTTVFNLEIEDGGKKTTKPALFWNVQFHPVKKAFVHIDFYGVDLEKNVKIVVPIEFVGTAKGTKLGGKLETYREQVTLEGKPLSIPAKIQLDITDMDLNDTIHVSALPLPEGVKAYTKNDFAIVSIISRESAESEAGEGEEAATA